MADNNPTATLRDHWPNGRYICYEGDDPEKFAEQIRAQFGFDPSADKAWGDEDYTDRFLSHRDPFGRIYYFLCPAEHLDAICASDHWPTGS